MIGLEIGRKRHLLGGDEVGDRHSQRPGKTVELGEAQAPRARLDARHVAFRQPDFFGQIGERQAALQTQSFDSTCLHDMNIAQKDKDLKGVIKFFCCATQA